MSFSSLFTSAANISRIQALRPDLAAAGIDTAQEILDWYTAFGRSELTGDANNAAIVGIDEAFLLSLRPDVAAAVAAGQFLSATQWYLENGAGDGLAGGISPSASFNLASYLAGNSDLGAAGIDTLEEALSHYVNFGAGEGRLADGSGVDSTFGGVLTGSSGSSGVTGSTFQLTTSADNFTGTANDDTFNAALDDNTEANNTFTILDNLDGGAGTDTLNLIADTSAGGLAFPAAEVSNIENIFARNVSGQTLTIDASLFTGESQLWSDRSTNINTFNNVADGTTIGIQGNGTITNATTNFTTAANVASQAIAIANGTTAGAINVNDTGDSITSVSIASTGASNTVGAIDLDADGGTNAVTALTVNATTDLTTGNITNFANSASITVSGGASSVNLGTLEATTVTSVDASGLTSGGLTAVLNNVTTLSVVGGAGDDALTSGSVLTTGTVDGGAGTGDTITFANSTHIASSTLGAKYTNFEVVGLTNGVAVDFDNLSSGITSAVITDGAGTTALTDINSTVAGAITVRDTNGAFTIGVKDAGNVGQIDSVALTMDDGDTTTSEAPTAGGTLTIAGVENLSIAAVDDSNITTSAAVAGALTSVTLTGAGDHTFVTGNVATSNFALDASGSTGTNVLNAGAFATNGVAVTGGSGVDTITGSAQADILSGGTGNDRIIAGGGVDSLTGGDGVDEFVFSVAALSDLEQVTDFTAGASGDEVEIGGVAAVGADGAIVEVTGDIGGAASAANGSVYVLTGSTVINTSGNGAADIAAIQAVFFAGGDEAADNDEVILVFREDTDGDGDGDVVGVWHAHEADATNGDFEAIGQVAVLANVDATTDLAGVFNAANFDLTT